jgi:hypothetical protein
LVTGQDSISYNDTLVREWGTYDVTMDMAFDIEGECQAEAGQFGTLDLTVEMSGEQLVVVEAEGFSGEYPWAGSHVRQISLPLEEGATAEGEGWAFVLHISGVAP